MIVLIKTLITNKVLNKSTKSSKNLNIFLWKETIKYKKWELYSKSFLWNLFYLNIHSQINFPLYSKSEKNIWNKKSVPRY